MPDGKGKRLAATIERACREIERRDPAVLLRVQRAREKVEPFAPGALGSAWGSVAAEVMGR